MKKDRVLEGPGAFGVQSSIIEIRVMVSWNQSIDVGIELFVQFVMQLVAKLRRIRVSDGEGHHLQPEFPWLCGTEFGSVAGSAGLAECQIDILTSKKY